MQFLRWLLHPANNDPRLLRIGYVLDRTVALSILAFVVGVLLIAGVAWLLDIIRLIAD